MDACSGQAQPGLDVRLLTLLQEGTTHSQQPKSSSEVPSFPIPHHIVATTYGQLHKTLLYVSSACHSDWGGNWLAYTCILRYDASQYWYVDPTCVLLDLPANCIPPARGGRGGGFCSCNVAVCWAGQTLLHPCLLQAHIRSLHALTLLTTQHSQDCDARVRHLSSHRNNTHMSIVQSL